MDIWILVLLRSFIIQFDAINNLPKTPTVGRFTGIDGYTVPYLVGATQFILTPDPPNAIKGSGYYEDYGWGQGGNWAFIMYLDGVCYGISVGYTKYATLDRHIISFDQSTGTFGSFAAYGSTFSLNKYRYWFYCVWK